MSWSFKQALLLHQDVNEDIGFVSMIDKYGQGGNICTPSHSQAAAISKHPTACTMAKHLP